MNEPYETAVKDYAARLLDPENGNFLADFVGTLAPFIRAGLVNGISQTLIKLVAPGVPDIYQGSERLDLSLVDPDNRRAPDFEMLAGAGDDGLQSVDEETWRSGRLKQAVIAKVLNLRQQRPELFASGSYIALQPRGKRADHLVSFARQEGDASLLLVAPRLVLGAFRQGEMSVSDKWAGTELPLPEDLQGRRYREIFSGRVFEPSTSLSVGWAFADHSFALLVSE